LIAAIIGLLTLHGGGLAQTNGGPAVPPAESVDGIPQSEWSRAWWQWAASFERNESPIADPTGAQCDRRQSGNVWFLAGTYETKRTVRTCRLPRGKHLFFPLINFVAMPPSREAGDCPAATRDAALVTDAASHLVLEVDGVRVPDLKSYRQATAECFDIGALTVPKVRVFPAAANGYYVMLRPLAPGTQTLNFGGVLPGMMQAITYTLHVE